MSSPLRQTVVITSLALLGLLGSSLAAERDPTEATDPESTAAAADAVMDDVVDVVDDDEDDAAAPRSLRPEQLSAVRAIGRGVLAAKRGGSDDPADAEHLGRLRASLDALIAADLDPGNRSPITLQGQETGEQRRLQQRILRMHEALRADAWATAAELRRWAAAKAARAQAAPEADTRSAGLPIGAQRARMFERWAERLDAALAEGNENRLIELQELREQLSATPSSIDDAPLSRGTPTLQAMPADDVAAGAGRTD
jgi:hypothetical protein